jgi:Major tropism determinant N-terminal domain
MAVIQIQRGTAAALTATNPVIADGQIVYETDTGRFKIGDGSTAWTALAYQGVNASYLTAGSLPDARLSSAIATYAGIATAWNQSSSALDIYPRGEAGSAGIAQGSGTIYWTFFTPSVSFTVSSITMVSGTTAASGLTLARMGLYTFDETTATLVARTASDTTLFGTVSTAYQRSLSTAGGYPATYTLNAGSRYGVGVICVGTTAPLYGGRVMNAGVSGLTPRCNAALASQTDLVTSSSLATAQGQPWARLT